jgi:cardiolipin synthase
LHVKVAVVDDYWATVGSSNLDPTSLSLNLEANVVVRDENFAKHLRERIEHLMQQRCALVQLTAPGPLLSAWIVLRNALVYHAMRHFAALMRSAPDSSPRVIAIQTTAQELAFSASMNHDPTSAGLVHRAESPTVDKHAEADR